MQFRPTLIGLALWAQARGRDATADEVRGSLWVHIPSGGQVLMKALQPPIIAAVAGGLSTMWVLTREPKTKKDTGDDEDA